jgi:hypothetical protein
VVQYCLGQEMWFSTVGDRKCGTVMLGQEMWYSNAGDRKFGKVLLWTGNVVECCWVQEK